MVSCKTNGECPDADEVGLWTQVDPLRGSLGPRMFVPEQCICNSRYTAQATSGQLRRYGYENTEREWVNEKRYGNGTFCAIDILKKTIILPRQARDKHRESSKKDAFLQDRARPGADERGRC